MRMKSLLYPPVSLSSLCVDVVSKTQVLEMERLSSNAKKIVKLVLQQFLLFIEKNVLTTEERYFLLQL